MRIVIDMQGAQTQSRRRGIGRYTLSLAKAMVLNRGHHEIILALNGIFSETIAPIRQAFQNILPPENIRVWYAPGPVSHFDTANDWRRKAAELTREAFLASLNPSIVLVSSMFEGSNEDAVTSIGELTQNTPTAVILYDLILLIQGRHYLANPAVKIWYERKLTNFRRADLVLSISESARQEGLDHLGFQANEIVNISSAADDQFRPGSLNNNERAGLRDRYGLRHSIVMYTGGIDHRKNVEALIRAYALLPATLRQTHQLALVCAVQSSDRVRLDALAKLLGLGQGELVMTGYVPEEDLLGLYKLCTIFVFPSWHEGFGLPALEAMACGKAVLGANTSSLPEVIGTEDALFDPFDDDAIKTKMERALVDDTFRRSLEQHGLHQAQKFSWEQSAQTALRALEDFVANRSEKKLPGCPTRRPRLAYVSPLSPDRSGISGYSAEMLPELARHYQIDVIVTDGRVDVPWINANFTVRTVDWFRKNASGFDRVLYHFGNSKFHQHMFDLLDAIPGVVVLHDFFLSGVLAQMELSGSAPGVWTESLYSGHGYGAVKLRFESDNITNVIMKYPCTQEILLNAQGVIVHSAYSQILARRWYGRQAGEDWACIPHMRLPVFKDTKMRISSRSALELGTEKFVVCSFGLLANTKCNHRLLESWITSSLAHQENCMLIFVGEVSDDEYGHNLRKIIKRSGFSEQIRITGWVDDETYRHYLASADVGVQLRTHSRGETSGAALDCMNYGMATIINANGSMAELPDAITWKLPDEFTDAQLVLALSELWSNSNRRNALGNEAQRYVHTQHSPRKCALQYFESIESFSRAYSTALPALTGAISEIEPENRDESSMRVLAEAIDRSIPPRGQKNQLFLDVSGLIDDDFKNESQRVVRNILQTLLLNPPVNFHVEPVYKIANQLGYCYARQFTLELMSCPSQALIDEPIAFWAGDIFLGLDLQAAAIAAQSTFFETMRCQGVAVKFVVHDAPPSTPPIREVVGEDVYYFKGTASSHFSQSIIEWLQLYEAGQHPKSDNLLWLTWEQSAQQLQKKILPQSQPIEKFKKIPTPD
jgi:glycosyltransferase involved in cell wall biosynthesis